MAVKAIPEGYHTITPYLIVRGAAKAIDYYKQGFGAKESVRMAGPDGKIGHAELEIGDSKVMLADEGPGTLIQGPESLGGTAVSLVIYDADVDATFNRAVAAGGKVLRPLADQFYGDRTGTLQDPFGHIWTVATHKEDVSPEEMKKRMAALYAKP
jgi:PhnB protein